MSHLDSIFEGLQNVSFQGTKPKIMGLALVANLMNGMQGFIGNITPSQGIVPPIGGSGGPKIYSSIFRGGK